MQIDIAGRAVIAIHRNPISYADGRDKTHAAPPVRGENIVVTANFREGGESRAGIDCEEGIE
jgi:hypothetical protein